MHHPTDVLAGSSIGILSAFAGYLIYYPKCVLSSHPHLSTDNLRTQ